TTKTALLVAAGQTGALMTPAAILSKGVIKAMFIAKLKGTIAPMIAVLLVGTGSLVYCAGAGGQSAQTQEKALSPLEALRKENELLKVNLRVTLEKIQAMESELKRLRGQAQVNAQWFVPQNVFDPTAPRVEQFTPTVDALILKPESVTNQDVVRQDMNAK